MMSSNQTQWAEEVTAFVRERKLAGDAASEIASGANERFGTTLTRNAVCGKLHRLKITKPPKPPKPKAAPKREPQQRARHPLNPRFNEPRVIVKRAPPAAPEPGSTGLTILDLRSIDQCRYITSGEGRAALYCGSMVREGSPWCQLHHSKCTYVAAA